MEEPTPRETSVDGEARWPMVAAVLASMVLTILLEDELRFGVGWLLPLVEGILLVALVIGDPGAITRRSRELRLLEPKTMIPAQAATQKIRRARVLEVVQRVRRAPLTKVEGAERRQCDGRQAEHERALVGHRGEVDREDQRSHENDRQDPAEVVDRVRRLVDVSSGRGRRP